MSRFCCVCLMVLMFACQGCFDLIEQLTVRDDGSGNLELVLNMSRSKTKINSMMKLKTVNGHKVPSKEEVKQEIAKLEKQIRATNGISNVSSSIDFDNFIAVLKCDFKSVAVLNEGIKKFNKPGEKPIVSDMFSYDATMGKFTRLNRFPMRSSYEKMSSADREVFATASYTGITRFESEIAQSSNGQAKVAANKRAVMLKANTLDIIREKVSIENTIKIKR